MSKDVNILLLGQTGVGKTTFINAFANYLIYHSLDDAIKSELLAPIPTSFSFIDPMTFNETEINIGVPHDSEQTKIVGQSCTRECRSFIFRINNKKLRLIDTPGVGDTQGVEQDEKNFMDILACISQYEYLNGICILLKPNDDRINISYKFCLKELLRHLHIQATENIMFVFTNARATNYQPGRAAPLLRTFLEDLKRDVQTTIPFSRENTFLLDNEAFRFLALCKNGIESSPEDKNDYSRSWSHTINEFERLLSRIVKCEKHLTRDTISLNEAQQLVRKLSRPIGEITTLIQKNIELIEIHKKNASSNKNLKQEFIEQLDVEVIELGHPRTVCTSSRCAKMIVVNGLEQIDYATHCHPHCYLVGVEEELIGDEKIKSCAAINKASGKCIKCSCGWKEHMHITYELRKFISKISINSSTVVDQRLKSLKAEKDAILEVCSKLAYFIRMNSINPVNDDILAYIQHFIREEKQKRNAGAKNDEIIMGLEKLEEDYRKEIETMKELIKTSQNNSAAAKNAITPGKIFDLVHELYHLPLYGKKIREQVQQVKLVQQNATRNRENMVNLSATAESSPVMIKLRKILV